jgi:hypothetical protein
MRQRHLEVGRLEHDGGIGARARAGGCRGVGIDRGQQLRHAHGAELLVGREREHQVARAGGGRGGGDHRRGEPARHVVRAAAHDAIGLGGVRGIRDGAGFAVARARPAHGVEVSGEHHRGTAARAAPPGEHARSLGVGADQAHVEAAIGEPRGDHAGEFPFAGSARHERRVGRVDRDEPAGERRDVVVRHPLARSPRRRVRGHEFERLSPQRKKPVVSVSIACFVSSETSPRA